MFTDWKQIQRIRNINKGDYGDNNDNKSRLTNMKLKTGHSNWANASCWR